MIEAIREVGEYANIKSGETNLLENFTKKIRMEKKNKKGQPIKQHIVLFDFNLDNQTITCDFEEVMEDSGKKYLWLGNNQRNKPQIYFTSDLFAFILGDSLSNIIKKVEPPLKNELLMVLNTFFDNNEGIYRVRYDKLECLDKGKYSVFYEELKKIESVGEIDKPKERAKKSSKKYLEELNKIVLKSMNPGLELDEVSLYSLKINGSLLVHRDEYRQMLHSEKIGCLFELKNRTYKKNLTPHGNCSLCDKKRVATTSNATNLAFKFYNTDKVGFSSDLDGKFIRNFNICTTCYADLLSGERFIDNNLKLNLGGINCYMIPTLLFKNPDLNYMKLCEDVSRKNNAVSNFTNLSEFERELKEFREFDDEQNNFLINYLFYRKGKGDFKILKLIKDVPPSRLEKILSIEWGISTLIKERYNNQRSFNISLRTISKIIPLGLPDKKSKKVSSYASYLDILDSVFSNKKIDYSSLIGKFIKTIKIVYFKRPGYTVTPKVDTTVDNHQRDLILKILQMNFALKFFKQLDLLKGIHMEKSEKIESIPDEILQFWDAVGTYNDPQRALFLLGYLIGGIGNKQWKAGHKSKPILNKINFEGMNIPAVVRLTNEVFEKMIQYKILKYHESLFYQFKKLIDTYSPDWGLNNQENVFYILSGYSFASYQAISKGTLQEPIEDATEEESEDDND